MWESQVLYKNPIRTSQETHYVSATESKELILLVEAISAYCENHKKHKCTLLAESRDLLC
jgi:hypothetical protein